MTNPVMDKPLHFQPPGLKNKTPKEKFNAAVGTTVFLGALGFCAYIMVADHKPAKDIPTPSELAPKP